MNQNSDLHEMRQCIEYAQQCRARNDRFSKGPQNWSPEDAACDSMSWARYYAGQIIGFRGA